MAFQTLKKVTKKKDSEPQVSITKDALRFNTAAQAEFGLGEFHHLELLRDDQDAGLLAVKLLDAPNSDSNKLSKGVVSATAWIEPYALVKGVYDLQPGDEEHTLLLSLAKEDKPAA